MMNYKESKKVDQTTVKRHENKNKKININQQ